MIETIIINNGKIIIDSPTTELSKSVENHILSVEFGKSVDVSKLKTIEGIEDVKHLNNNNYKLFVSKNRDVREAVFHWAVENKNSVLSLSENKNSLEDVFHKLTSLEK